MTCLASITAGHIECVTDDDRNFLAIKLIIYVGAVVIRKSRKEKINQPINRDPTPPLSRFNGTRLSLGLRRRPKQKQRISQAAYKCVS